MQHVPHAELILTTWAAREELDLIHIHHNLFLVMGAIPALATLAPVITSLHDYWPLDPRGQLFDQTDATQHPLDADAWEAGVAQTWPPLPGRQPLPDHPSSCAAMFKAHGIQQPIRVIENGVPTDHLAGGVLQDTGSPPPPRANWPSAGPACGSDSAICWRCISTAPSPTPNQGDPTPKNALRELCANHPQLFTLAGPYQREQPPAIFCSSDLVVVPSLWEEVYRLVAREALSYGLPLIVSSAGGLADLAERSHVFQLNHHDPEHWGTALEEAFSAGPLLRWIYQRSSGELPPDGTVRSSQACTAELAAPYREVVAETR